MLLTEQDTLRAISIAKANPDKPDVIAKAKAVADAYKRQQEAQGKPLFPETERARQDQATKLRSLFTDRERHGLDEDAFNQVASTFSDPEKKARFFNNQFLSNVFQKSTDEVRSLGSQYRDEYAKRVWGAPVASDKEFADRLGQEFDFEDEIAKAAKETSLQNLGVLRSELTFKERFRENSAYVGREQKWDKEFQSIKERFDQKLAPHRSTVKLLSAALMTKEGVDVEDPKTMDEAFAQRREIDNAPSYRELAEIVMKVPAEDRKLVIAAAVAASANDEAGRKSVMEGLVEMFDRGVKDFTEEIPSQGERPWAIGLKNQIKAGFPVSAEDAATPEAFLAAASSSMKAGISAGLTPMGDIAPAPAIEEPGDVSEEVKSGALALADRLIEAIDLRGELRNAAENEIDPITSDFVAIRGLYATARSIPYMAASFLRGGLLLNAGALQEQSYQQLRAVNPTMSAEQAQLIASIGGPFQAYVERLQGRLAMGQFKAVNRFFNQITRTKGAVASRFLTRTAATAGLEMVQENVQDLTPFVIQGLLSALDEDMPEVPWEPVYGDLLKQQPELFFAVLPLAVIGGGAGTYSDFKGAKTLMANAELIRLAGVSEAAASDIRARVIAGDMDGAQAELRRAFQSGGQDLQSVQQTISEAVPRLIEQRDRVIKAIEVGEDLDILPGIRNLGGDMWALEFNDGSGMSFNTYGEAADRMEQIGRDGILQLHEDVTSTIRRISSGIEADRGLKYLFSSGAPVVSDAAAVGKITDEEAVQAIDIADTLTSKQSDQRPTRHRVFEGGSPISLSAGPGILSANNETMAFRITGQPQIDDIISSGEVRAKKGKMRGGRTGETQWSRGHSSLAYSAASNKGRFVLVAPAQGLNNRTGGLPISDVVAVYESDGSTWQEVTPRVFQEFATSQARANLIGITNEERVATARIIGETVNEFRDNVLWTTMRFYQNFTPDTVLEEKFEGDAKYLIHQAGQRAWMVKALREWEIITGDRLFVSASDEGITNRNLIEAWSAMGKAWFVGEGDSGRGWNREKIQRVMETKLGSGLTAYAEHFAAVLRRAALIEQAKSEGKFESGNLAGIEDLLRKYSGESEQRLFERDVQREASAIAQDLSGNPDFSSADSAGATFSLLPSPELSATDTEYLAAVERGDMVTAQRMVDEAARAAGYNVGRVYHGTMQGDFDQFVSSKKGRNAIPGEPVSSSSFWFTDNENLAAKFAQGGGALAMGRRDFVKAPAKVFDVFLRLNNPQIVDFQNENLSREEKEWTFNGNTEIGFRKERTVKDAKASGRDGVIFKNALDGSTVNGGKIIAVFDPNQIKSADPVTYDEQGNVIPLSQRFNPARDEITYSLLPDASNLDTEFARMFSPFQRSPELRMRLGQEMARRTAEQVQKLRPILRANRTKKDIEAERKKRQDEIFSEKLDTLSPGEIAALSNQNLLTDSGVTPILDEILRENTRTTKTGRKVRYWTGSLMSKSEAKRRGIDTAGGEWDAIPEGLPPYVWGGSLAPDQAATMFNFETPEAFFDALTSEIRSRADRKREVEAANRRIRELEREAREESRAWAEKALEERETVGTDRATLLGFLRALEAIKRALPAEVRGRIGGSVALAQLTRPAAMLDEIESRVEMIDREIERWMKAEADDRRKRLFEKVKPKREAGKKPKGKAGADIHDLFDKLREALLWDGDEAEAHASGLEARIAKGELSADAEAHAMIEANLVRLFSDWKNADAARRVAAVEAGEEVWRVGYLAEKKRIAKERERRAEIRADIIAGIGKLGSRPEREAQAQKDTGLSGQWKEWFLSLFNFEQVAGFAFGADSKWTKWFSDSQREAEAKKIDEVQGVLDGLDDLFRTLGGSRLGGERLQWKLGQKSFSTKAGGSMSELEGITALLMWRQEDGRRHMKGKRDEDGKLVSSWSYDEDFIAEIEANLSSDALAVMDYLTDQYAGEYDTLNPIFRELNGINLPRNANYSPLSVKPQQAPGGQTTDPVTGSTMSNGSMTPGSLRTRAQVVAEPEFRNAVELFVGHKKQLAHWKAYAIFNRDAQAILGNREVGNSIEAGSGAEAVKVIRGWLDLFAQGGVRDAGAHFALSKALNAAVGRAAAVQLVGRIGTLAVQVAQLGAAAAKMPVRAYVVRLSKLLTGNLGWGAALDSPYIQRRLAQMPPSVQVAMEGLRAGKPNAIKHAAQRLGRMIAGADALFTAGTYAMVHDYQFTKAVQAGLDPVAADQVARSEAERIVDEVAQPTRAGTRSLFESTSTNPLARVAWAFASEGRKNLALLAYSFGNRPAIETARAALYVVGINGILSALIRTAWRDLRDDEEREDEWELSRIALAVASEPLYGFPGFGEVVQSAIFSAAGEWKPSGSILETPVKAPKAIGDLLTGEGDLRDLETILTAAGLFNDNFAALASFSHLLRDAASVANNLTN